MKKKNQVVYDLIPYDEFTNAYVKVAEFGAKKYAPWGWTGSYTRAQLLSALLRHSFACLRGRVSDPESGLPHVYHILWNAVALVYYHEHGGEVGLRLDPRKTVH